MMKIDDKLLPKNIRKLKQDLKDLSILESLKYIERNEKLDLVEKTFGVDANKQEFDKIREKHKNFERLGLECVEVHSLFRIKMSKENTLKDLIELLEETIEIYWVRQWSVVDLDTKLIIDFGEPLLDLSLTNIKDLKNE